MQQWKGDSSAFTMLDLGHEHALIDAEDLPEKESLEKKLLKEKKIQGERRCLITSDSYFEHNC